MLETLLTRLITGRPVDVPDWPMLRIYTAAHGLGPMLWYITRRDDLRDLVVPHTARWMLLDRAQYQIEADLPRVLWFKGAMLARLYYPEPALRPMVDLDLLVQPDHHTQSLAALRAHGYHFVQGDDMLFSGEEQIVRHYHDHLRGGPAEAIAVELHTGLLGDLPVDVDWFWAHTAHQETFLTLQPAAHLLYLCAHAILQHGEAEDYLLRWFDLHQLITQEEALDWNLVVAGAVHHRWTYAVERALLRTVALFETPLPDDLIERLRANRPADEETHRVEAMAHGGTVWRRSLYRLRQMGWRDRYRTLARAVLPPPAYMRHRYDVEVDEPLWPYYLRRWWGFIRQVAD